MTIELMSLVTILSVGFAIFSGIVNLRRNNKSDVQKDTSEMTTVLVKLENIQTNLTEIKNEFRRDIDRIKADTMDNHDDIIRIDTSLKSAWNAINEIKGNKIKTSDDGK